MELSLREAANCVGAPEEFSVKKHFFGFIHGDPFTGPISIREQIAALKGHHIHIDLILVAPSDIDDSARRFLDTAIQQTRKTFSQVNIGVGRVRHLQLPKEEAQGFDIITKKSEAKRLTKKFRGPSDDAMDLFVVPQYKVEGKRGICNIMGCNKDLYVFNGCVVGMPDAFSGRLIAHELGHGLRLIHKKKKENNLMKPGGFGTELTKKQGKRMRRDCFVQDGCDL